MGSQGNTTISEYGFDLRLILEIICSKKLEMFWELENKPVSFINLGISNQNIGLDRQNFKFNLNYKWNDNKTLKNLSLINIELKITKTDINYFNIYSSSYNSYKSNSNF